MPNQAKANRLFRLEQQVTRLQRRIDTLQVRSDQLANWRALAFTVGSVGSVVAVFALLVELGVVLAAVTVVGVGVLVRLHRRVQLRLQLYQQWQHIKQTHLARMTHDWDTIPLPPAPEIPTEHPFATDLNLYGKRSMHHLLDTTATYEGSQRLADWLLETHPDRATALERQQLVQATREACMFRDKLSVAEIQAGRSGRIRGQRLLDWFEQASIKEMLRASLRLAVPLAVANIVLLLAFVAFAIPPLFLLSFFAYGFVVFNKGATIVERLESARSIYSSFVKVQAIFSYLEQSHVPALENMLQPFKTTPPSDDLRRLTRIIVASSARQNPLLGLILNVTVPYDMFFALQLEQQTDNLRERMHRWLDTLYTLEALNALANFAYLNPEFTFPTLEDGTGLQANAIGHPLLPDDQRVSNDFSLAEEHDVVIITGSNMSGKSTFLRTLGVNLVLSYTGGPVCADMLTASVFRVFSSIKVTDSINDGISYFYAEVRRLKALLDELQRDDPAPVFFMIDEIFRGTNNRERLIGSRAYIRAVAEAHGVGLVATHDLELVQLGDEFDTIRNFHFREDIKDGRMVFDYQIRQGPSPTTNALRIMEIEGLPVE
jgi:ABC-type multidrug transport system fused ATPase/permease subunit